jgi:hypothetical protein
MKTLQTLIFGVLIVAAGYSVGCSSDGNGQVPPGVLHGSGGSTAMETVPASSASSGGSSSSSDTTGAAGSVASSASTGTASPGGSTAGVSVTSSAGASAAGSSPSAAGTLAAGGTTSAGGTVAAGGSSRAGGTTAATTAGGGAVTGGATSVGGVVSSAGGTRTGGAVGGAAGAGGTGGLRTGGTTSSVTSSGTVSNWWPTAFDAAASPNPANGKHNAGKACLSCHVSGGQAPSWLFGGTIYDSAGTTGVAHLQIGIKDGTKFFSTYSATNGNIWLPTASNTVNWANAEIRLRSATGEKIMGKTATSGDCNSCHSSGNRILTP